MASPLIVSQKKQSSLYANKIELLSPAKINLYLNILGQYPSGFHKIESIIERISLFDLINIKVNRTGRINVFCSKKSIEGKSNLCYKAAKLIKQKLNLSVGFDIFLKKNIPIGSGLGGGSSNAATTILGIDALLGLNLSQKVLYQLGGELGSDVNFFLCQSKFALISGKGQEVKPIEGKSLRHFIIWPRVNLSTRTVYRRSRVKLTKFLNNVKIMQYALRKGDIFLLKSCIFNALEKSALSLCKEIKKAKNNLYNKGVFATVTGSGSALYTVLDGLSPDNIKDFLPKRWFVCEVKTF